MDGVKTRFPGIGVALMIFAAAMLVFATAAQAQTPAEDQYGSPTDSSTTGGTSDDPSATGVASDGTDATANSGGTATATDPGDTGSGSSVASSASAEGFSEGAGGVSGGVLPSTGGAPIYLLLAGMILVGTGATLWMRFRAES